MISDSLNVIGFATLLPPERTVLEVLENVPADPEVLEACRKLKKAGFVLALDDYTLKDPREELVEMADIIKVDVLDPASDEPQRYSSFRGYFYSRPATVSAKDVPVVRLHLMRIMQEIHPPEMSYDNIEGIMKQDVSLAYKFLRFINAAAFGWKDPIRSIRQALALIGERETQKWVTLVALAGMAQDKPHELMVQACIRGRFVEALALPAGLQECNQSLVLMGLFSVIDAVLDRPIDQALAGVSLDPEVKDALLGSPNRLRNVFDYVMAYERAEWGTLAERASRLGLDESEVPRAISPPSTGAPRPSAL